MSETLIEAKKIYTKRICKAIRINIYDKLYSLWEDCKNQKQPLNVFQEKLEGVHSWNSYVIDEEFDKLDCVYFDKLVDAIFIVNAKILSSISKNNNQVSIKVPNIKKFFHSCFISCAYDFFTEPYLFDDRKIETVKKQRNYIKVLSIIDENIKDTIENLIPYEDVLSNCLAEPRETHSHPVMSPIASPEPSVYEREAQEDEREDAVEENGERSEREEPETEHGDGEQSEQEEREAQEEIKSIAMPTKQAFFDDIN
jgi:hypothetical protein